MLPKSKCEIRDCKYYKGRRKDTGVYYCLAFFDGIPDDISYGDNEHLVPVPGQNREVAFALPSRTIVAPHPEHLMDRRNMWGRDNLCATLRNIYFMTDDPEIRFWLRMCVTMAKNMMLAIYDYKQMLIENSIGCVHRTGVQHDRRDDWQLRRKCLYRGTNKPWSVRERVPIEATGEDNGNDRHAPTHKE